MNMPNKKNPSKTKKQRKTNEKLGAGRMEQSYIFKDLFQKGTPISSF